MTILKADGKMIEKELALILNIQEETVKKLAKTNQLPCTKKKTKFYFDFQEILNYFAILEKDLEGDNAW